MKNAEPVYLKDYKVPDFLIETVNLEFELEEDFSQVKSTLSMRVNPSCPNPNKNLILNGEQLELLSIYLDNKQLNLSEYEKSDNDLIIFNVPNEFVLQIETRIKPQENKALSGLYKSSGNFCTQCEAEGFRRITYFLDRPDVMAKFTTTIIADQKKYPVLLSNGNKIVEKKLPHGKHIVTWEDPFKKPSYLFALVAGDFVSLEDSFTTQSGKPVALKIYVEKGNGDKCQHAMQAVKKAMHWDEQKYGREYDLNNYMIVAVSDFNMGAMENKGLNIFNTQYILANSATATDMDYVHIESVVAHEYFHNWTGNRITCRDWFQLSLKEGLTVFRDQSFTADTTSKTVARIHDVNNLRNSQFPEDAGPLAHPVRPNSYYEIDNFYTATVYNKGAEVIRMQQTILGDDLFRKGMDLYFSRYDGQAVTIEDFVKAMEDASEINLSQFRLWYSQAGTPLLQVEDNYDEGSQTYSLKIKQSCPATPDQPEKKPFHIPIKMGLINSKGQPLMSTTLQLKDAEQTFQFEKIIEKPVPSLIREFSAPVKVNYNYSDEDLQLLFQYDEDNFNRWSAGQQFAVNLILRLINDFRENKELRIPERYFSCLEYLIKNLQHDNLLLAEMLTLPSEKYIGEQMAVIDVEAIHYVREFISKEIAKHLKNLLVEQYQSNNNLNSPYEFTIEAMGKRQLSHRCLYYLGYLNDNAIYENMILRQFDKAMSHNMTDTISALQCIVNIDKPQRERALSAFYNEWKNEALVVDKWLALQASSKLSDTLLRVKKLLQHPAFDLKNPNKVYSLLGVFTRNAMQFHAADGQGYQFIADCIIKIDTFNPHVAARLVKSFSDWKRYNEKRQKQMRHELERIKQNKLISKETAELVMKSLEN